MLKRIVVLTGAGISAESGLKTFRDAGGLWEGYSVSEVATPEAWERNPELVLRFYNERRKTCREAQPNAAHRALVTLEEKFAVQIVTQNVDDLHERAGSSEILHLHGEIMKARSTAEPELVYQLSDWRLTWGMTCERGSQLRPHIVWFGETVPMIEKAIPLVEAAEILLVIGTSLAVYPAAGLVDLAPYSSSKYLIDPKAQDLPSLSNLTILAEKASVGVPRIVAELLRHES